MSLTFSIIFLFSSVLAVLFSSSANGESVGDLDGVELAQQFYASILMDDRHELNNAFEWRMKEILEDRASGILESGIYLSVCNTLPSYSLVASAQSPGVGAYVVNYLGNLAKFYAEESVMLELSGYPKNLWEEDIGEILNLQANAIVDAAKQGRISEIASLDSFVNPFAYAKNESLYLKLEAFRVQSNLMKMKVMTPVSGGCGGDYMETVFLRLNPPDGKLEVMAELTYRYCKNTGKRCDDWSTVLPDAAYPMGGGYYLRATWSDGFTKTDKVFLPPTIEDGQTIEFSRN